MKYNIPFLLAPAAKDYLWGGSRLNDDFNKGIDIFPLAETWECSTHPEGESRVASGPEEGKSLGEVLDSHPEYLGSHSLATTGGKRELPILIKLIDAKEALSVQVHPNDEYAREKEKGQLGKTEMWYVLDSKAESTLVYGFNRNVRKAEVKKSVKSGTVGKLLNRVPVKKGDLFYIEAGTVHAIGAGCLIAEIQESSNLTYRLYDYDRVDKKGNKRELHVEKALEVINYQHSNEPRQPIRVLRYQNGVARELLARCKYFQVERVLLNTESRKIPEIQTADNSFHVLLITDGCGVIYGKEFSFNFFKGDCVFVPAASVKIKLHGNAELLEVSC